MAQETETTLREQLADIHRMMVFADLLDYSGHVSARIPGKQQALILPRDVSRAGVTPDDMLLVDFDGKVLAGPGPAPTETEIHLGVYRARGDVMSVGHGHPPLSTLYSMVDAPMIAMRNFGFRFIDIPIYPDPTHIRTKEQSAGIAKTIGKGKYCLLRGHGSVIAVGSVAEVFLDSLELEENVKAVINARNLGPLKPITPEEVERLKVSFARNEYRVRKTWEHYKEKAKRAGAM
jgi:ribulose-5-phosphate 4-epimerase/fuculose-1-phosphate aldolase